MRDLLVRVAADVAIPMLPVLGVQAWLVHRDTPRLPPAGGPDNGEVPGDGEALRIVLLGESPVDGVGVSDHRDALGGQLAVHLARHTGRRIRWHAVGRNGMTARKALRHLVPRLPQAPADLLVIALGVNDCMILSRPGRWASDLRHLILRARAHLGGHVPVALSAVPPMDRFPALPRPLSLVLGLRSRALDAAARAVARRMPGVRHVPLTGQRAGREHFCEDGFHPSTLGYERWAALLAEASLPLLPTHH